MSDRVLILDDDPSSRAALDRSVQISGFQTIAPNGPFCDLDSLRRFAIEEMVTHVVTDHRLRERPFTSFLGAAAAAALSTIKIAPVLVTAFATQDMDRNIRPYLGNIPQILQRNQANPRSLKEALSVSAAEIIEGHIPRYRRKYRSVVRVADIVSDREPRELRLEIRQWRKDVTVGFPVGDLVENIRSIVAPGMFLIAQVNIEAQTPDTLFLMDFELAPTDEPDVF